MRLFFGRGGAALLQAAIIIHVGKCLLFTWRQLRSREAAAGMLISLPRHVLLMLVSLPGCSRSAIACRRCPVPCCCCAVLLPPRQPACSRLASMPLSPACVDNANAAGCLASLCPCRRCYDWLLCHNFGCPGGLRARLSRRAAHAAGPVRRGCGRLSLLRACCCWCCYRHCAATRALVLCGPIVAQTVQPP